MPTYDAWQTEQFGLKMLIILVPSSFGDKRLMEQQDELNHAHDAAKKSKLPEHIAFVWPTKEGKGVLSDPSMKPFALSADLDLISRNVNIQITF